MQKINPQDRRIFERLPVRLSLGYLDLHSQKNGQAQTCDISANGLGLVTDKELVPQTPLDIWLHIPDKGEPLYTRGEVVWTKRLESNNYRVGINLEKTQLMAMSRVLRVMDIGRLDV